MVVVQLACVVAGCGRVGFDSEVASSVDATTDVRDGSPGGPDATAAPANRAFVTSTTYLGDLGGLDGADAKCQARAVAAGLDGQFTARLRTSLVEAADRMNGARGWRDLQGRPIADLATDWAGGQLIYPMVVDEFGAIVPGDRSVWTGEASFGNTCGDWTLATVGDLGGITFADDSIVVGTARICSAEASLICVERNRAVPVAPVDAPGRYAFVSTTLWAADTGRPSADAVCVAEASAAGLPGSYLAYLAAPGEAPSIRFDPAGLPWKRVDGARLAPTAADLVGAAPVTRLETYPGRTATGGVVGGGRLWVGSASNHCENWSNQGDPARALKTPAYSATRLDVAGGVGGPCDVEAPLWCLQE